MDLRTDGPTDGRMDKPSYRDAFLTVASKNEDNLSEQTFEMKDVLINRNMQMSLFAKRTLAI